MTIDTLKGHPSGMSRLALGMKIYENPALVIIDEPTLVRRSWRERLFSFPWRPLEAMREEMNWRPDPDVYLLRDRNMIMVHPQVAILLQQEMEQRELERIEDLGGQYEQVV